MRELKDHIVESDHTSQLKIEVLDEPGQGGANHSYQILEFNGEKNPSLLPSDHLNYLHIMFQNGPIQEVGINGVTHEALLAILIDRLRSFQAGSFASPLNALALTHGEQMLNALQERTRDRIRRGVEGKNKL